MLNFMRKLIKDRRGNALVLAAAALPMLVGSAGLATDTIQWALWKRQLQRAADSAAIAGVYDRVNNAGATTTTNSAVSHDITINNHTGIALKSGYPQVSFPGDSAAGKNQVRVVLALQKELPFSSIFLPSTPTISTAATAASIDASGEFCMLALNTGGSGSPIYITGNAAIDMNCALFSMGSSNNAALSKGSASVTATSVAAVGGIQQSNNWHVGSYQPYSTPLDDPFSGINPSPSEMNCSTAALSDSTSSSIIGTGTGKFNCFASLSVGSNKTLTLPSNGTYYINGGSGDVKGTLNCSSCTIIFTNKSTSNTATIGTLGSNGNTGSQINITAPTTGKYKGIAIMQDRRSGNTTSKINGNSNSKIQGALYFPKSTLDYNGTGSTSALCTMFIAYNLIFSGNSGTANKFLKGSQCTAYGLPTLKGESSVRLVA